MEKRAEIGLQKQAWEIAHAIGSGTQPSEEYKPPLTILLLGRSVESHFLWVTDLGIIEYSSNQEQFPVGRLLDRLPTQLRPDESYDRNQANIFKNDWYLTAEVPESRGGSVLTFVALNTLQTMYQETLLAIFSSLLAALIMALVIAFFIIRYLVKPLRALEDFAQAVGNRKFDQHLEIKSDDELSQLAAAFNQMSDQLKSYDESMRSFFQNASHELKTPLMSINGYAEAIRDGVFTGPALDSAIDVIHKESVRLRNVVENIIDLTILDQQRRPYLLPHDLGYIMEQVTDTVGGYALERGVLVETHAAPPTLVIGDWDQLHSLLVNLLSNAIRHAGSKVSVRFTLIESGTRVRIAVEDDGTGFTATDFKHAFDYFYSGAPSGSGLGLTIAQKIVWEHSGQIRIYNSPSGGAVAEVILPVAAKI